MSNYKYCLSQDFSCRTSLTLSEPVTFYDQDNVARLHISKSGLLTVLAGYAWDGCTPKLKVFDWFYLGTPDGTLSAVTGKAKAYYASLVHDAIYQFLDSPDMPLTRKDADELFHGLLKRSQFSLAGLYYSCVRALGGFYRILN